MVTAVAAAMNKLMKTNDDLIVKDVTLDLYFGLPMATEMVSFTQVIVAIVQSETIV